MATHTTFKFIDRNGNDVTATADVNGYLLQDFFASDVREITRRQDHGEIRCLLGKAYRGADCDGIGVEWTVTEGVGQ